MKGLQGKVAVIAGGGRGIGKAIAEQFAKYGSTIVIGSRTKEQVAATAEDIRLQGGTAHGIPLDVTNRASVDAFFKEAMEIAKRIDILVYCAGTNKRIPAEEYPLSAWNEVLSTNLQGAYHCCQEAGKRMIAQKAGAIVTITSMLSHVGTPNQSAYAASKGGLLQYSKTLAVEWAKYNIRVNAVSPGYIETDLTAKNFKNPAFRTAVLGKTPMDRFGEAAEVADAVCFLSSDAASYITGACIPVDGGFIAGHPGIVMQ